MVRGPPALLPSPLNTVPSPQARHCLQGFPDSSPRSSSLCLTHFWGPFLLLLWNPISIWRASQVVLVVNNPPANARDIRDMGLIPGSRSPGTGHGYLLQCSCLENPMDRGACLAGYSPWGCKESDKTEVTQQACTHSIWKPKSVPPGGRRQN